MNDWLVPLSTFDRNLAEGTLPYWVGLAHGSMRVELFRPQGSDTQQSHAQDELYIILSGSGSFSKAGEVRPVRTGDVIFVEAGVEHRFETFSDDFATWVIFWGPEGGEREAQQ